MVYKTHIDNVHTDDALKERIVDELWNDDRVDAREIHVEVKHRTVILSGTVPTYYARVLAEKAVGHVPGIVTIINDLVVAFPIHQSIPGDEDLRLRVAHMLRWEPDMNIDGVEVTVTGGVVTLDGTVDAYWRKLDIEDRISRLHGVSNIDNRLSVVPSRSVADNILAEEIQTKLAQDREIDIDTITIFVAKGVVTLRGVVQSKMAEQGAVAIVERIPGVVAVRDELNFI